MPEFDQTRAADSPLVIQLFNTRTACALLLLGSSLVTSGCLFGKKPQPRVFVPPPIYAKDPAPTPKPTDLPPAPEVGSAVEPGVEPVIAGAPNLPPAPAPKPAIPKTTPAKPPAPVVVENAPAPVVNPPKPAPIFSAEERRKMNQEIDQSLGKVRAALARVEGRTLSAEQTTLANNARNFMLNAEQTRVQDLVTAASMAKRAESFAAELLR